jgi:Tol biopolymer transport system component
MQPYSSQQHEQVISRRSLLALAASACAWNWRRPTSCRAQDVATKDRPKSLRPGRIIAYVDEFAPTAQNPAGISGLIVIDPENDMWRMIADGKFGSLSRDGKFLAYSKISPDGDAEVWTCALDGGEPPKRIAEIGGSPIWSPDCKQIVFTTFAGPVTAPKYESWRMNADGSNRTKLALAENETPTDWSPDGKWLATQSRQGAARPLRYSIAVIHPDGTGRRPLTDAEGEGMHIIPRFSPDGRRILYFKQTGTGDGRRKTFWLVDLDGGNRRQVPLAHEPNMGNVALWSPNGERIAVSVFGPVAANSDQIEIGDTDGKEWHVLPLPAGRIVLQDWR